MHALTRFAEWLLGIPEADPGQGNAWRYVQNFPWPSWALLLFSVGAAIFVFAVYRRDAGHLSRSARVFLAVLRLASLAMLLFMLSEAMLSIERTGLPFVVVMLDNSGSMATEDLPAKSEAREFAAGRKHSGSSGTRFAAALAGIKDRYRKTALREAPCDRQADDAPADHDHHRSNGNPPLFRLP